MIHYLDFLIPLGACVALYGMSKYIYRRHEKDIDSDMMIGIYDKNLKCLEIKNPIQRVSLGINNADFIGKNIRNLPELVMPKNNEAAELIVHNIILTAETNKPRTFEYSCLFEDGNIYHALCSVSKQGTQTRIKVLSINERNELAYRYSTIFHSVNIGVGVRDIDGKLVDFNAKFLECYGVADVKEFIKLNTELNTTIIPLDIYNDYVDKKPGTHIIHYNYDKVKYDTNRSGVGVFEVTINPMIDDNGVFVGIVTLISEITDKFNNQKEIKEARQNLNVALNAGGVKAWTYDVAKETLFRLHGDVIDGDGLTLAYNNKRLHPDDVKLQQDILASLIKGEKTQERAVFRYLDTNNEYKSYKSHMMAKKNEKGEVTHVMGTQKDLSEEIKKNDELNSILRKNEYILKHINSAIAYIGIDYRVIWGNVSEFMKDKFQTDLRPYETGSLCYESIGEKYPCPDCILHKALISGQTVSKQLDIKEEEKTLEVFATAVSGDADYKDGVIIRIDEITERKNLYSQLENSRNKAEELNILMQSIFDKLPCLLFIRDITDGNRYILANDYFCRTNGFSRDQVLGRTDFDLFEPAIAQKFREDDLAIISKGGVYNYDEEIVLHGIRTVWQTSKYIIEARNGHKLLIGLALDVTDKTDAFTNLEKAKNRAEEADKLKSAFIANMSHEIRTPLNAIVGFSDLLQSTTDPEEIAAYMSIININNVLLLGLIDDIIDLSKIDAGMIELKRTRCDLAHFFTELSTAIKHKETNPDVELIEINPYKQCVVMIDQNRFAQVFTHFVNNAIKFTTKGFIKMGYEYVDNGIKVYVQDTGIGISKEKQNMVFQRFEKLNAFTQGTGLGLSVCEAIMKANGGKIGFESEEGVGSTFWAWIECDAEIS